MSSASDIPLLETRHLTIRFGGLTAVSDLCLSIRRGELRGLIGPNGAGKTTAFNLITGVYRPTSGSVLIAGRDVTGAKPHRIAQSGLSRTFQNIRLFPSLSVLENVLIGAQLRHRRGLLANLLRTPGHLRSERRLRHHALDLLSLFGLSDRAHLPATSLCYGDQRKLEIARALATRPQVLCLDEPAAGMNPQEKLELASLIRSIRDRFNLAIWLIEHDMKLVMSLCQMITVLDHGETIAVGTPEQIRSDPRVIEAYLGEGD